MLQALNLQSKRYGTIYLHLQVAHLRIEYHVPVTVVTYEPGRDASMTVSGLITVCAEKKKNYPW